MNLTPLNVFCQKKTDLESDELPYEDLFKDTEDCGPKVNEGVAKGVKVSWWVDFYEKCEKSFFRCSN